MPIMFNSLLKEAGIDPENVRLVRHHFGKGAVRSPYSLWKENPAFFEEFQCQQGGDPFAVGNIIASFVVTPQGGTLFIGMYRVDSVSVAPSGMIDRSTNVDCGGVNFFNTTGLQELSEYRDRLSIEWGGGFQAWSQWASNQNKTVREIRLKFEDQPFPGYFLFRWKLNELSLLPVTWADRLKTVKGVYVLTSLKSGAHYVGSAAGQGGFLQRWQQHAAVGGDAISLQAHDAAFQVAILQVASGFETEAEIVRIEHHWMDKLQTRGMGLNGQPRPDASETPPNIT